MQMQLNYNLWQHTNSLTNCSRTLSKHTAIEREGSVFLLSVKLPPSQRAAVKDLTGQTRNIQKCASIDPGPKQSGAGRERSNELNGNILWSESGSRKEEVKHARVRVKRGFWRLQDSACQSDPLPEPKTNTAGKIVCLREASGVRAPARARVSCAPVHGAAQKPDQCHITKHCYLTFANSQIQVNIL